MKLAREPGCDCVVVAGCDCVVVEGVMCNCSRKGYRFVGCSEWSQAKLLL